MKIKRIKELADFFYSSNSAVVVPLRLSCMTGRYTGFDLDKESFVELLTILSKSQDLKRDLFDFVEAHCE